MTLILALDGRGGRERSLADGVGDSTGLAERLSSHPLSHRAARSDSSPIKGEQGLVA
jgi:hypothetical protein